MPLTEIVIKNAKPREKAYKLSDGGGLFLSVTPAGGKVWRLKYRFAKKEKLLTFGKYPQVTLKQAREKCVEAKEILSQGKDPGLVLKREKRVEDIKFETIARDWHSRKSPIWSQGYADDILSRMEAYLFPEFGDWDITAIEPPDVLDALLKVEDQGKFELTHRLWGYVYNVFVHAIAMRVGGVLRNPAVDIKAALQPVKTKHYAYIKENGLKEFYAKCENESNSKLIVKCALDWIILTMTRTGETRVAEWNEIDEKKVWWVIPEEKMKMEGRGEHIVPLSRQALIILDVLRPVTGHCNYIFPNDKDINKPMSNNAMLYALYEMGYRSKATVHGFRTTADTILNENGFNRDWIERQLAHAESDDVREAYNRAEYLEGRTTMMQWWADHLDTFRPSLLSPKTYQS